MGMAAHAVIRVGAPKEGEDHAGKDYLRLHTTPDCAGKLASIAALLAVAVPAPAAQRNADDLAQQLSNPVAALISVPLQLNYDTGYSPGKDKWILNIQPVVPISITDDWNMISRTILPLIAQDDSGLGDITQSLFFSPKRPTASSWIIGVGPALLIPTGSNGFSLDQWAAGPTAVMLKQEGSWTYGALVNQLWSFSNSGSARDVNAMFLQPFVAKGLGGGRTVSLNTESTYDWNGGGWTIPVNLSFSKVTKWGSQMVSLAGGVRVYLDKPEGGPDWGLRGVVTLMFPK